MSLKYETGRFYVLTQCIVIEFYLTHIKSYGTWNVLIFPGMSDQLRHDNQLLFLYKFQTWTSHNHSLHYYIWYHFTFGGLLQEPTHSDYNGCKNYNHIGEMITYRWKNNYIFVL